MIEQLRQRLNTARYSRHQLALRVIPMLIAALQNKAIQQGRELTADESLAVLNKEKAKRLDAAAQYDKANAPERAANERAEIGIIDTYLPQELTEDAVLQMIEEEISAIQAAGGTPNLGLLMKPLKAKIGTQFPGQKLSGLVKTRLESSDVENAA